MLRNCLFVTSQSGERPIASRVRICHRLQGSEGLRRNKEKRLLRIQVSHRFGKVGSINVGDKSKSNISLTVILERLIRHHRSKIRTADSDVDDIANSLTGVPLPRTAANAICKSGHLVEHSMDR